MNKATLTIGIILLSLIALLLLNVLNNFSTGSELDYYTLKETTDASVDDAIDNVVLRECGIVRLDRERFVDSFLIRFANEVDYTREYDIKVYDINEVPPKVSIKIDSLTALAFKSKTNSGESTEAAKITTTYDAIAVDKYTVNPEVEKDLADRYLECIQKVSGK